MSGQHSGPAHEGNSRTMGTHADEKSDGCIVPVKPRTMPSDIGGGDGGGKTAGRGKGELQRMPRTQCRNRYVTETASPRIGAAWVPNTPKADHVRPRQEPGAGKPHAGICAGGEEQSSSLPRPLSPGRLQRKADIRSRRPWPRKLPAQGAPHHLRTPVPSWRK